MRYTSQPIPNHDWEFKCYTEGIAQHHEQKQLTIELTIEDVTQLPNLLVHNRDYKRSTTTNPTDHVMNIQPYAFT